VLANVVESNGVWLSSTLSHAEDLVAVWVIEEVLIPFRVRHQEGIVVLVTTNRVKERIVTPFVDTLITVGFGVLEPAPALTMGHDSNELL